MNRKKKIPHLQKNALNWVIVSNRLPFILETKEERISLHRASGGLITALFPMMNKRGGIWVGNLDRDSENDQVVTSLLEEAKAQYGIQLSPLSLSKKEIDLYYHGFANEIIWPLFHDLVSCCIFTPAYWDIYQSVNQKFAQTVAAVSKSNDIIWVHDYHLMLVGQELKKIGSYEKIGFFLHIPFPSVDLFSKLPWRNQILQALLKYDLLGFQTFQDRRNFIQCVRQLLEDTVIENKRTLHLCKREHVQTRVGNFPISIDFNDFSERARAEETAKSAWLLHEKWQNQKLIFSIDRLDYTKGIPYRLEAVRTFLQRYGEFHKKICFVQVIIPSREDIPEYQSLKREIDRLVGEINSQFTQENWVPIQYIYRSLTDLELLSYYRTSEVMLVTPVKDGMNLISKEYVACQIEDQGVLILSEFAGSATQLNDGALLVNPHDIEGIAQALYTALVMPAEEQSRRLRVMKRTIKRNDLNWWVKSYIQTLLSDE